MDYCYPTLVSTPGRNCTCVIPFRRRVPSFFSATRAYNSGRAPRLRSGYLTVPSGADYYLPRARGENGGLCGHCSRDLPLDRRLLFVAELTGQMVGCVGNAPTRPSRATALQAARGLYADNNPVNGYGTWSRTTIRELMRLPWFSTFP